MVTSIGSLELKSSISIANLVSFITGYEVFANITRSNRGFPMVAYNGHRYGRKSGNIWVCTRSDKYKKRCTATVCTRIVDGYTMLRIRNPIHICEPY